MKGRAGATQKRKPLRSPKAPGGTDADDWREGTLSRLREVILKSDPAAIEEMKWKKPSNPEGVPVWSHDGIICVANVLKNAVRLTFPYGPEVQGSEETIQYETRQQGGPRRRLLRRDSHQ